MAEGDKNTSFFHKIAKQRSASCKLNYLKCDGLLLQDSEQIKQHVVGFFESLYSTPNTTVSNDLIESVIPKLVTEADNNMLTSIPSFAEIKEVVFRMCPNSAPGPDGFTGLFYQIWE